jgi:hypothetical protein
MGIHANADHFESAVKHGFALLQAGLHRNILITMANGFYSRGLADAGDGYIHVYLRTMLTIDP